MIGGVGDIESLLPFPLPASGSNVSAAGGSCPSNCSCTGVEGVGVASIEVKAVDELLDSADVRGGTLEVDTAANGENRPPLVLPFIEGVGAGMAVGRLGPALNVEVLELG